MQGALRTVLSQWTRPKQDQKLVLKFTQVFLERTRDEWLLRMNMAGEVVKETLYIACLVSSSIIFVVWF